MVDRISPNYLDIHIDLANLSFDEKIALLEDRMRGFIFTPLELLQNIYDSSILLITMGAFSVIEILEVFYRGESSNRKSRKFFKSGADRIFGVTAFIENNPRFEGMKETILDRIYDQIRIGLFHMATLKSGVVLNTSQEDVMKFEVKSDDTLGDITINPIECLRFVNWHLSQYFTDLRNPSNKELRDNFEKAWVILEGEMNIDD